MKHDFVALEAAIWAATAHDYRSLPAPEVRWCTDYPRAMECALVKGDFTPLLALFDAGKPLHPMLLPALADVTRARGRPAQAGRKPRLTTIEARMLAKAVSELRNGRLYGNGRHADVADKPTRRPGLSLAKAAAQVAEETGFSEYAVKAAYREVVPPRSRPPRR